MQNKKVIYTAIFGDYDNLTNPSYIQDDADYICFSDRERKSDLWKIIVDFPLYDLNNRNAKKYKILPHKYLKKYKYSCWIDGNMDIISNINELFECLDSLHHIAFNHKYNKLDPRQCIYEELEYMLYAGKMNGGNYKDNPQTMIKQVSKYKNNGYPKNNGLTTNMILLRKHNCNDCIEVMNDWWEEIHYGSKRDQLSFNYVAWKNKFKFMYINEDSRNNKWFKQRENHKGK